MADITPGRLFRQGVLIDLLNPKVAVSFLAFLPQFVVPGAGPAAVQILAHGMLIIAVAAAVELPLILVGARLAARLRRSARPIAWVDRGFGTVMILLGLRLASADR